MGAFDDLIASLGPQGSSAWGTVSAQLSAEGADQPTVVAAQNTFTSAWTSLSTTFGMNADSALSGAAQYTYAASTISGSVAMVQGFVGSAQQASTPAGAMNVLNMFTGSMIGIAVAAGAVSAGIGAAIVAAVGVVASVMQSVLGSPPGIEICPGITTSTTPNWVINCTPVFGAAYSPGQNGWRKFPSSSEWFTRGATANLMDGYTGQVNAVVTQDPNLGQNLAPIEVLFPNYSAVVQPAPSGLEGFHQAFIAAWEANKEFALNGQKVQDDATVLQHCILVWNRAHDVSSATSLTSSTGMYEGTLVQSAIAAASPTLQSANYISGDSFVIHTGPIRTFSRGFTLHLTLRPPATSTAAAAPSAAKTVVGVSAATVGSLTIAAIAISLVKGKAWDWAFGQAWAEIKDVFDKGGPHKFLVSEAPVGMRRGHSRRRRH